MSYYVLRFAIYSYILGLSQNVVYDISSNMANVCWLDMYTTLFTLKKEL